MRVSMNEAYKKATLTKARYRVLYGGAGSGKSHFVAQETILNMLSSGDYRYLAVRKTGKSIRNSVFKLLVDMIHEYNLETFFNINKTEMAITCSTGSELITSGLDDVEKLKSIANINKIWVEEASEITELDFDQLDLRLRGQSKINFQITLTFNPISETHWLKTMFFDIGRSDSYVLKTTYKDNRFLDAKYIKTLYELEQSNPNYFRIYALGDWGNIGKVIFSNWEKKDLSALKDNFDNIYHGLDWGFSEDPTAYIKIHYDKKKKTIYILDEFYQTEVFIDDLAGILSKRLQGDMIICDSAEPRSIADLKRHGIKARPAKKGQGSVEHGIKFLQSHKIVIDTKCTNALKEIAGYRWKEDKDGNAIPKPMSENDHLIDALRYSLNDELINSHKLVSISKIQLGI